MSDMPQGALETRCPECSYTYGTHANDCPRRILLEAASGDYKSARQELKAAATNLCSVSTQEAFTTTHDPADVLKAAMTRQRKVLGSLGIEWVKFDHAEAVVDQLIALYRDACSDRRNAIAEIERVQQALAREQTHLAHMKGLVDGYRKQLDQLAAEGLALKRTGQSLKRKLRSIERSGRRK